jgi:N-acylneuraminate cytidylyltransferase
LFDRVIVNTDSHVIADIAIQFGAEVPNLRDPSLADDYTPVSLVTINTLKELDPTGITYQYVAQLMANCPLRPSESIVESYHHFLQRDADVQMSVTRYGWLNPWWAMERDGGGVLTPLFREQLKQRSQDLPELFCPSGAVWWAKSDVLCQNQTFHVENRIGWEMPWQEAVDIDDEADWQMAEFLMQMHHVAGS